MSRILIADANGPVRTAFGLILQKKLGVSEIKEATNLTQLQSCLAEWQPDVILLDCQLPGLVEAGGLTTYRPSLPGSVIALSIRPEDGPPALAAGVDDFIPKSFTPEQVLAIIKKNLAQPVYGEVQRGF
jgi:DNA-binding NarL/FixJ family response regulator